MKNNLKARFKSWFKKDKILIMIFSLLIAAAFWIAIISYVNPDTKVVIQDVPVRINTSSQDAVALSIVSGKVETVDIEVVTPRSKVPSLNVDTFTAEIDLTGETKAGTYVKSIIVTPKSDFVKVSGITPSSTTIVLDVTVTKTLPIIVDDGGYNAPEGYYVGAPTLSSDELTVTGPKAVVDRIDTANVTVAIEEGSIGIIDFKEREILLLDSHMGVIEQDTLTMSVDEVTVSIPVIKTKTVPLELDFVNMPSLTADFYTLTYSIDGKNISGASEIEIAAIDDVYDDINKISLGTLDFSTIGDGTFTKEYTVEMPTGVTNISKIATVTATIRLRNLASGTLTIPASDIHVAGTPAGKTAAITSKSVQVSIRGTSAAIRAVQNGSFSATVQLTGNEATGVREHKLTITFEGQKNVWVYVADTASPPSVNIEIK